MIDLELVLPTVTATVRIGQSINEVRDFFSDIEATDTYIYDAEINRHYLCYYEQGFEFVFQNKALSTVYVHIAGEDQYTPFCGAIGCLDEAFFLDANIKNFYNLTISNGYVDWFNKYGNKHVKFIDMVKNGQRIRYSNYPKRKKATISFSGITALMQKVILPLNQEDLLPLMIQELKETKSNYNLDHLSEADYAKNCIQTIEQLNKEISSNSKTIEPKIKDAGKVKPRHVICALGNWTNFDSIIAALEVRQSGFSLDQKHSILDPNPKMKKSFNVNQDRLPNTLDKDDWDGIENHTSVAYILSPPIETKTAEHISSEALKVIATLFEYGATAIQSESAGLSHGKKHWLNLAKMIQDAEKAEDEFEIGSVLYKAWVQRGIVEGNSLMYTIGMHLLGHPDIECLAKEEAPERSIQWTDALGLQIAADRPAKPFTEGQVFRLSANDQARKTITMETCSRKPVDSFQYTPYGYLRLNPETGLKRGAIDTLQEAKSTRGKYFWERVFKK